MKKRINKKGASDYTWIVNIIVGGIAGLMIGILITKTLEFENTIIIITLITAVSVLLSAFVSKFVDKNRRFSRI